MPTCLIRPEFRLVIHVTLDLFVHLLSATFSSPHDALISLVLDTFRSELLYHAELICVSDCVPGIRSIYIYSNFYAI